MTSQAADGPETVAASRRSKITPEREREFFDAVLEQIRECGYDSVNPYLIYAYHMKFPTDDSYLLLVDLVACTIHVRLEAVSKYKQIIFEGYKLMGRGGAHETDPYPNS